MLTAIDEGFRRSLTILLTIYLVVGILVIVALVLIIRALARTYLEYRGKRLVVCPETKTYATVEIDEPLAAITSLFGWPEHQHCAPELRIENCSRTGLCLANRPLSAWVPNSGFVDFLVHGEGVCLVRPSFWELLFV